VALAALIETLREYKIAGADIDVFDQEPLPGEHPFRHLPNVLATPHLGYGTRSLHEIFYKDSVDNIKAWVNPHNAHLPLKNIDSRNAGIELVIRR
jgi:phosphoglycerate dehydrogenase-like enzyme